MLGPRSKPPFRADHVGSLLRPPALVEARKEWREGKFSADDLRIIEDACIREAVAMQEEVGLKGITDGDFRREDWFLDFMFSFDGIERSGAHHAVPFSGGIAFNAPVAEISAKIRCPEAGIGIDAFKFLQSAATRTAKVCIPAPAMFYTVVEKEMAERTAYDDWQGFWSDLGVAYAEAVGHLAKAGCIYLQIDDVNSANIADPNWQQFWASRGLKAEEIIDRFIALNNAAIDSRPQGMTAAVHMCRGNYQSEYAASGSYDMVAERYFNGMKVDAFFLEYDDSRSGGFEPLRFMPKDKTVVLGLMTSKTPALEPKDVLKRRIEEASRYVDLDRLCLSPQCGFASTQEGNRLTEDEQRRKLRHLVEVATEVWGGV